jgi:hypothetical protein
VPSANLVNPLFRAAGQDGGVGPFPEWVSSTVLGPGRGRETLSYDAVVNFLSLCLYGGGEDEYVRWPFQPGP